MNKSSLRKYYLAKRKTLSPEEVKSKSEEIKDLFFQEINLESVEYLHIFLPIEKQNEIDTFLIIKELKRNYAKIKMVVSRIIPSTFEMQHFLLDEENLTKNHWGILEPSGENLTEIQPNQIDLVIIPLLIFDQQGNRVGYGKGFYDRFLNQCRPETLKVGICLEEPIEQIEDVNKFDVKMDFCISHSNFYKF
ncbi:5-formyltetrahydrofolate cyclo-ligase [Arcicella aurantiaca]|uniref:5-formyltetrahydrofolate cyclo-ligase n=1 Tax=Arcicella aurantiaca TaxID=591202 RepID=A0A316ED84_9BACT|nr:5-formyltetrahydrofolate cyclo-ligase [Arcicella aurantiaca]PWK28873.1 5-formyltetrahydrofolate cyclo-ligase [Arcicella aurantiaca]